MNTSKFYRINFLACCFILAGIALIAQPEPITDGLVLTAPVSTYTIPDGISALTMSARGGDGGDARRDGPCSARGKGGTGAWTTATFEVGNGSDQLQPAGKLKIIVGQPGGESGRLCGSIKTGPYGGGGGSTAVLYLPPGESEEGGPWYILMIAGGGGGGAVNKYPFGLTDTWGGKGGVAYSDNGDCGTKGSNTGYAGAGISADASEFGGKRMNTTLPDVKYRVFIKEDYEIMNTGGADPDAGDNGIQGGGDGFNGGGAGSKAGAGGGGGYQGGNAGTLQGNGGGSFITTAIAHSQDSKVGGVNGAASGRSGLVGFAIAITP